MPIQSGGRAPYAPPAAVLSFMESYRNKPLPTPFTPEVLVRAGVNESLVPRTLKSLEDLELIDERGNPTPMLEGLRRVPQDEYKQRLEAVVREVYAEVFRYVDPATDDAVRVADQFRVFEPIGQRGRMVTLFLGLCGAAGIVTGDAPKKQPGRTLAPTRGGGVSRPGLAKLNDQSRRQSVPPPPPAQNGSIPPAIAGLLQMLPSNGKGWTKAQRDSFVTTFAAVLDFAIPMRSESAREAATDDDMDDADDAE